MLKRIVCLLLIVAVSLPATAQKLPAKKKVLNTLRLTNQYFMNKWPDAGKSIDDGNVQLWAEAE